MDLVVDASVVVKWFIAEDGTEQALLVRDDFVAEDLELHVPSHVPYEVLNAVRFNPDESEERVLQVQAALDRYGFMVHPLRDEFGRRAVHVAYAKGLTMYDSAYLALSQMLGLKLLTADEALGRAAGSSALLLRDYEPVRQE
jgi:predicted nucleic acid-binding protein